MEFRMCGVGQPIVSASPYLPVSDLPNPERDLS